TAPALDDLRRLIEGRRWVQGAVNYDEDLHFSTYYLRASWAPHTSGLYPGYTTLLAFYEGYNEYYYLPESECLECARAVVARAVRRPAWLPRIVREIVRRSDRLARVFPPRTSPERL